MKIIHYDEVEPTIFSGGAAQGVEARVVIGKKDGAENFCMRVFEIAAGGHTPMHSHDWEHEMFYHSGKGEVYCSGKWYPVEAGRIAFIPANEEHQIKNTGNEPLILACLVPAKAPEL
jgi:quercetin dioxygenase-like cupin family protein